MLKPIDGLPEGTIGFRAEGKVEADDYRDVLDPAIEAAPAPVNLVYVLGEGFDGYALSAYWEDTKLGLSRKPEDWGRIALVTDVSWMRHAVGAFAAFIPGHVQLFAAAEEQEAIAWATGVA